MQVPIYSVDTYDLEKGRKRYRLIILTCYSLFSFDFKILCQTIHFILSLQNYACNIFIKIRKCIFQVVFSVRKGHHSKVCIKCLYMECTENNRNPLFIIYHSSASNINVSKRFEDGYCLKTSYYHIYFLHVQFLSSSVWISFSFEIRLF